MATGNNKKNTQSKANNKSKANTQSKASNKPKANTQSRANNKSKSVSAVKTEKVAKSATAVKSRSVNRQKKELTEEEKKLKNEVMLIAGIAIFVLLELSCFGALSPVGDYISYFMFGCMGIIAYILPILLFMGAAFLISNGYSDIAVRKTTASAVMVILIDALIHLMCYGQGKYGIGHYYLECGENKTGGGYFGALISRILCSVIGDIGAYITILLAMIVCFILITERSFIGSVKNGGRKIYDTARDETNKIRENAENYSYEKKYEKNKRIHKKAKGVNIQKINNPKQQDENIHEITGEFVDNPENTDIYRGKVDVQRGNTKAQENVLNEKKAEKKAEKKSIQCNDIDRNVVHECFEELSIADKTENNVDEEGFFKPKEQIIVSEAAKNAMARGVYGVGASVKPVNKAVGASASNTSETKTEIQESKSQTEGESMGDKKKKKYILPPVDLLNKGKAASKANEAELEKTADLLQQILRNFGVNAEVTDYSKGPSVTRYEVQPEIGTRLSKVTALADDIKLNLAATDIRIEPIPGKSTIGIEVPNKTRESVNIRELIESKELKNNRSNIAFAAGKDIAGCVIVGDIAKMPHMLVAGTTGSGKSVFTNSIIMSILYRATPNEVRLIIVDPKVVEFGVYNGIPHLMQPVVTDPKLASNTLKWAVNEMSERYKKFADLNVRDLKGYNEKQKSEEEKMPQIVIVIDELADLMMVAAKEVEESICRLAQLARAAGIHLIIATQRPSVDVVTGLIKANIPSRCALMVSSGVDSRTIIDSNGAEKLLGNGDMLFYPSGYPKPMRLQGAFVSDEEVQRVVDFWKSQCFEEMYDHNIADFVAAQPSAGDSGASSDDGYDEYFMDAARFCIEKEKASTSMLQRMFKIGFNRASRIIDQLEEAGVIGQEEGTKPRKVLITLSELEDRFAS